ncbi:helix-turn-helix domain-containing protein [bacterium]|nr:helix-turn-helix domain-containing protein [bacterium]
MQVIGPQLKKARVQLSLTLDEISERTLIHNDNLERLEQGEWGFLPDVYLRGMLQQFADIVGVDVSGFLEQKTAKTGTETPTLQMPEPLESAPTISNKILENLDKTALS